MPNLRRFIVTIICSSTILPWCRDVFDGYKWQQLLTRNTSHLEVFDISLFIQGLNLVSDVDMVLKSFDYFATKYDEWYVAIDRSRFSFNNQGKIEEKNSLLRNIDVYNYYLEQQISLRGYRHSKRVRYYKFIQARMNLGIVNVYSTTIPDAQYHLFYSHFEDLHIKIPINMRMIDISPSGQLFKNIDRLTVEIDSSMLTFWEDMLDLCKSKLLISSRNFNIIHFNIFIS
jgi:hypothetical protein